MNIQNTIGVLAAIVLILLSAATAGAFFGGHGGVAQRAVPHISHTGLRPGRFGNRGGHSPHFRRGLDPAPRLGSRAHGGAYHQRRSLHNSHHRGPHLPPYPSHLYSRHLYALPLRSDLHAHVGCKHRPRGFVSGPPGVVALAPPPVGISTPFYCAPCGIGFMGDTLFFKHLHHGHGVPWDAYESFVVDIDGHVVFQHN